MYYEEGKNINEIIEEHIPFIIRTISHLTGRYVTIGNDDEYSIALLAFEQAIHDFDAEKGSFLSFARLVIESRLINYFKSKTVKNDNKTVSLDELYENGHDFSKNEYHSDEDLKEEISIYCKELSIFGLDLEKMADVSPKHRDTRRNAIYAAEIASTDEEIVNKLYQKKKLPIRKVSIISNFSEKVIKRSKLFILGTMLIFIKDLNCLIQWIVETRDQYVS